MMLATVTPAVEALPGNYNFLALVPLMLASVIGPFFFLELAARWLRRGTELDEGDEMVKDYR